jgi:hypothetical protein
VDSWLDRINEVVGYCVANDMYAIVNIHWDGGWLENNCTPDKQEENNRKQQALWTQIANKLNHYDEHLLFAGSNEPNVDTSYFDGIYQNSEVWMNGASIGKRPNTTIWAVWERQSMFAQWNANWKS